MTRGSQKIIVVPDAEALARVAAARLIERASRGADLPAAQVRADGDLVWLVTRAAAPERADAA